MCLAVPGRITEIYRENDLAMGRLDYDGAVGTACLECVPEVEVGQYVIVHAGFAISVVDAAEAEATLSMYREIAESGAGTE